ncbi:MULTISPECIES: lipase family alpha/beta hydrolase [unclassified Paenibacillus]|uniref:lipase family alpha/beta hydrolase n=1 Tax=unclassified Paenibacillus TaxID=185978 RepID=UPI00363CC175
MQKAVLLHGFNKKQDDMMVLKSNLLVHKLDCELVDLPLTFKRIDQCAFIFEGLFEKIISELNKTEKVSLIGHSSGGLVIRKFLSETKYLSRINKCVLIATPNQGSELADFAGKISRTYVKIFKTLYSLQTDNINMLQLKETNVEIGAIAGNKNNLLLGNMLENENDGRVEVKSVYYSGLKDFIVLPYGHKEIHYQKETADLIHSFIIHSKFNIKEKL